MAMSGRLGAMLVSSGLITDDQLKKALSTQKMEGGRLGSILVKLGFVRLAYISWLVSIPHAHRAATATTDHQPLQQGSAFACCPAKAIWPNLVRKGFVV